MNLMFNNKSIITQSYTFNQIFQEYSMKNVLSLSQFTIGKYGLKRIESDLLYKTTEHKMFNPNSMILGIGIEEIGFSFRDIKGCVSPIYNTYSINLSIAMPKYLKYVFPYVLNSYKYVISKKSTRREYEIESKALSKIIMKLPDLEIQFKIANMLEHFEKLITNEQRLLEKLSVTKKSLLDILFTKDNVTAPKLRFDGFVNAWEQRYIFSKPISKNQKKKHPTTAYCY